MMNNIFNKIAQYMAKSLQLVIAIIAWIILLSIVYAAFTDGINYDSCIDTGFCEEGEVITAGD